MTAEQLRLLSPMDWEQIGLTGDYSWDFAANLAEMKDQELDDLAGLLLEVVQGYSALYDGAMAPMPICWEYTNWLIRVFIYIVRF